MIIMMVNMATYFSINEVLNVKKSIMESTQTLKRTAWTLDTGHSHIGFKVKHMMVTNVRGLFKKYEGRIYTRGNDFRNAEIAIIINAGSISTNDEMRDAHLRSVDFFDTDHFKEIHFKGTELELNDQKDYVLHGNLTIKDVTKEIKLDIEFNGIETDPWGTRKQDLKSPVKLAERISDLPGIPSWRQVAYWWVMR